mgnify:CR=1 FL=1
MEMGVMENFLLAFNVVFPIFLIMMLGVILKRKNMVDDKSLNVMNSLIFRLFMPTLLFFNIYIIIINFLEKFCLLLIILLTFYTSLFSIA